MSFFTKTTTIIFSFLVLMTISAYAQNGQYDVRFNINNVDCAANKILVDIDVRANNPSSTFNLSDQNFRFSYSREAVEIGSVDITNQNLVGFLPPFSFYDPHTLTGSIDTVVSYNVVLAGGDGVFINTEWTNIGTISFNVLDASKCVNLKWHDHAPENFPPTFIGEKFGTTLYQVAEGNYYNISICPNECLPALPIELTSFEGEERDCAIDLAWTTASEINNAYFEVEKSQNGRDFETIEIIEAVGNSSSISKYTFTDEEAEGTNYYRLTQVDVDGESTSSDIIVVKSSCRTYDELETEGISSLYPNPVKNGDVRIKFKASSVHPDAVIVVTDLLGRTVDHYNVSVDAGNNTFNFSVDNLVEGAYFVRIFDGSWNLPAQKFIKLN